MSRYLNTGHYEAFLPINLENKVYYMRVWIETDELVKALKKLDLIFGTPEEPYCRDLYQVPMAIERLNDLIMDLISENPERLKRVCVERVVANTLSMKYGVKKMKHPIEYPEVLDQVELNVTTLFPVLNTLFVKSSLN
ncbi:MAG TPA: hypothetical protein VNN20_13630 [Thermodesulfobacteriota bacterium]|nr:hypothetical protein [Thermodesulfobacteriota bacterium]